MVLVYSEPQLLHWFVIPVVCCGALIGADAIAYLQGRIGLMDPATILGLLGVHFFFFAPLLHVVWDAWMPYIPGPADWRDWLGGMAVLNLIGLCLYRIVCLQGAAKRFSSGRKKVWVTDDRRAVIVYTILLLVCGAAQVWVYIHFGGISGYIDTYLEGEHHWANKDVGVGFNGMGWLFTISESFPILAMFAYAHYLKRKGKRPATITLFVVLACYFVLVMLFGGLRGSRSNTIWALFWAVGVIHFWVKRINRRFILIGVAFLLAFMYIYGFYKSVGTEALDALQSGDARESLAMKTGRTFKGSILGDLARSDIQAYTLFMVSGSHDAVDYAWGKTYLGDLAILIPRFVWPDRPPTKQRWTTELESGPGSYTAGVWESSHVFGMAGEAMVNFGPLAGPLVYLVLGFIVVAIRRSMERMDPNDSRWLMMPLLIMFTFIVMAGDGDNDIFFIVKYASIPLVAVILSSRRIQISELTPRRWTF